MPVFHSFVYLKIFLMFIFGRERECEPGRVREGDTESQALGSELSAQSSMWGSNPPVVSRSWDAQRAEPPGRPFLLSI